MRRVATHREAATEAILAALHYDQQVPGLGADFLVRYDTLIAAMRQRPRLFHIV